MEELDKNKTIVVESKRRVSIEIAHEKAKELFTYVSDIDSDVNERIHFFIIAPDREVQISEHGLLEPNSRQTFVDWCHAENEMAQAKIYKVDIVKY